MKPIGNMDQAELAAYVQDHLRTQGIRVVLSGGAAVGVYSSGKYVSKNIDLVNAQFADRKKIEQAMAEFGFLPLRQNFKHPKSDQIIKILPGPLALNGSIVEEINVIEYTTGSLHVLLPTDCVKDRLAHYYHWNDRQCLTQAILVAANQTVDLEAVEKWSEREDKLSEFNQFKDELSKHTA